MTKSVQKELHAMQALLLHLQNQLDMSVMLFCRQEVPRMLFEAEQIAQLATYVTEMHDPELLCWWGRYNESLGQFDTALEAYEQANDTVALVRLHCHQEDFVAACDVVEKSDNAAAAFMLARQLEATEQVCFPGGIPW
jgi:intraflagellar transport protein 140